MLDTPYESLRKLTPAELSGLRLVTKAAEGETLLDPRLCVAPQTAVHCEKMAPAGG